MSGSFALGELKAIQVPKYMACPYELTLKMSKGIIGGFVFLTMGFRTESGTNDHSAMPYGEVPVIYGAFLLYLAR